MKAHFYLSLHASWKYTSMWSKGDWIGCPINALRWLMVSNTVRWLWDICIDYITIHSQHEESHLRPLAKSESGEMDWKKFSLRKPQTLIKTDGQYFTLANVDCMFKSMSKNTFQYDNNVVMQLPCSGSCLSHYHSVVWKFLNYFTPGKCSLHD